MLPADPLLQNFLRPQCTHVRNKLDCHRQTWSLPKWSTYKKLPFRVSYWPCQQTLGMAGEDKQECLPLDPIVWLDGAKPSSTYVFKHNLSPWWPRQEQYWLSHVAVASVIALNTTPMYTSLKWIQLTTGRVCRLRLPHPQVRPDRCPSITQWRHQHISWTTSPSKRRPAAKSWTQWRHQSFRYASAFCQWWRHRSILYFTKFGQRWRHQFFRCVSAFS